MSSKNLGGLTQKFILRCVKCDVSWGGLPKTALFQCDSGFSLRPPSTPLPSLSMWLQSLQKVKRKCRDGILALKCLGLEFTNVTTVHIPLARTGHELPRYAWRWGWRACTTVDYPGMLPLSCPTAYLGNLPWAPAHCSPLCPALPFAVQLWEGHSLSLWERGYRFSEIPQKGASLGWHFSLAYIHFKISIYIERGGRER